MLCLDDKFSKPFKTYLGEDAVDKFITNMIEEIKTEIKTEGVYEDFSSDKEIFDFSNYSTKSKYYDDSNKLVIGKMKDETGGLATEEFVGLKVKMYSFLVGNSKHKKSKRREEKCCCKNKS